MRPKITRGDAGQKLQNGLEVETCDDRRALSPDTCKRVSRHPAADCVNAADWLKFHPFGKHAQR